MNCSFSYFSIGITYYRFLSLFIKNIVKHLHLISFTAISLFLITSCKFQVDEGIKWDTDLLAPIAFSTVTIEDLIQDSTLLEVNGDNSLSIIYRDTLASLVLKDLVDIPDTTAEVVVTLDSLKLSTDSVIEKITLGFLAKQLVASGDPNGQLILDSHGTTLFAVPAFSGLSSGLIDIDASNFFEFADLSEGNLDLKIRNELPLNLANVHIRVGNKTLGNNILTDTFEIILARDSAVESYDLADQQVESTLEGEMTNLDIQSGLAIPVDTNDFIEVVLRARNLKAYEATAVFPQQTIIDTVRKNSYKFPNEFADVKLTLMKIKSGRIEAKMISTIQDSIRFSYQLVSATKDGEIPGVAVNIDPAPANGSSSKEDQFELGGFILDMTQNGTPGVFNSFFEELKVDLLYSGNLVNIDLQDSVVIQFGLVDIEAEYIEGYFGKDEFRFTGTEALEIFEELDIRNIAFSQPSANLLFSNSIGLDSRVSLRQMKGQNLNNGRSVRLNGAPLLAGPVEIMGAQLPDTTTAVITDLGFTPENSNIRSFINLLPGQVEYDILVETNINSSPGDYNNFASDKSEINTLIDINIPLDGVVDQLVLMDTAEMDLSGTSIENINSALLRVIIDNQYPFEAQLKAVILNSSYQPIEVLTENFSLAAGMVNASGYAEMPTTSVFEKEFDQAQLITILNEGKFISFEYSLSTQPEGEPVSIYYDYQIKARLVGQFNYSIK